MKRQLKKQSENHEHMVGNQWATFSMVITRFSGVIVVMSGDVAKKIFQITLIIFVKGLQMYPESITTCLN